MEEVAPGLSRYPAARSLASNAMASDNGIDSVRNAAIRGRCMVGDRIAKQPSGGRWHIAGEAAS